MNKNLGMVGFATLASCGSVAGTLASIKLQPKITGKPVGCEGSLAHVITNDKIPNKISCFADMQKESIKDSFKLVAATGAAAGAGALATVSSPTVKGALQKAISKTGKALSNVSVSGKSVKDLVASTKAFTKFNALPAPAKAAILAGSAALAVIAPLALTASAAKAGYIEAQHENINYKLQKAEKVVVY